MPLRTLLARLTATCLLAALLLQPATAASEPKTFKL